MAMNQQLAKLLTSIKEAKKDSELDIDLYPMKVRPSLSIAKADGSRRLESLVKEYRQEVSQRAAVILTRGPADSQAAFAVKSTNVIVASALTAYTKMAVEIEPTMGSQREFAGTQLGHLIRAVEAVGREAGSSFLKVPTIQEGVFFVRNFEDLVIGIRDLLLPQLGAGLNRDYLQVTICDKAMELGFKENVVPVIVTDASEQEVEFFSRYLFSGVGIVVDLPEDAKKVDDEFVTNVFAKLKATAKAANQ